MPSAEALQNGEDSGLRSCCSTVWSCCTLWTVLPLTLMMCGSAERAPITCATRVSSDWLWPWVLPVRFKKTRQSWSSCQKRMNTRRKAPSFANSSPYSPVETTWWPMSFTSSRNIWWNMTCKTKQPMKYRVVSRWTLSLLEHIRR